MDINTERRGGIIIARISGRIEGGPVAEELQERLNGTADPGDRSLVLDCREIAYISSAGLRAFMIVMRQKQAAGVRMIACGMSLPVRTVFEVSGIDQLIPVMNTLEEALEEVRE